MLPAETTIYRLEMLYDIVMHRSTDVLELPVVANQCTRGIEVVASSLLSPLQGHSRSRMIDGYGLINLLVHVSRHSECDSDRRPGDNTSCVFRAHVKIDIVGEVDNVCLRDNCDWVACSEGGMWEDDR